MTTTTAVGPDLAMVVANLHQRRSIYDDNGDECAPSEMTLGLTTPSGPGPLRANFSLAYQPSFGTYLLMNAPEIGYGKLRIV